METLEYGTSYICYACREQRTTVGLAVLDSHGARKRICTLCVEDWNKVIKHDRAEAVEDAQQPLFAEQGTQILPMPEAFAYRKLRRQGGSFVLTMPTCVPETWGMVVMYFGFDKSGALILRIVPTT